MRADAEVERTLDVAPSDRVEAAPRFSPGSTIAHFRVIRELGAGGMGVVFEAHDPDLDRRVAIKLVRDRDAVSAAGVQLIREAQAMARLAHPNVVAVYEVGTLDDQVFVVMELVAGETLSTWLEQPRPWREIVLRFAQAGDGLLAAHHAGLIHRDFKPSNVLIDQAGRARVSDFGLARADDSPRLAEGSRDSGVAGTPAYMAPEQRAGDPIDARADQYAYAVSLQEALGPKHAIGTPPRRIRAAVARALAIDPAGRFPTMHDLLVELRRGLVSRRRAIAVIGAGLALCGGTVAFAAQSLTRPSDECERSAQLVDELWSSPAHAALLARFSTLLPTAHTAAESSAHAIDDWAAAWKLGRRAACSADPPQRTARLACLDQRLDDLRAQLAVWATADRNVVEHALQAATSLPAPDTCAVHPEGAALSPALRTQLAELSAMAHSGRAALAKPRIAALLSAAEASANPSDLGSALLVAGEIERETGDLETAKDHLSRAAKAAGSAGNDRVMLRSLVAEATLITDLGRPRDSLGLLDAATAIDARTGLDRNDSIGLARGDALAQAGRSAEAIVELRRILPGFETRAARDPGQRLELDAVLGELAGAQREQEDLEGARTTLLRVVVLDEAIYGRDDAEVGKTLHDLAGVEIDLGHYADAAADIARARTILVAAYGEHHRMVAAMHMTAGKLALAQNKLDDARASYERARDSVAGLVATDHPYFAVVESALGQIDRAQDHCAAAIPHYQRALAIYAKSGAAIDEHAHQLTNLGVCLADVGRKDEATRTLEQSLAEIDANHLAVPLTSEPLEQLADLANAAGHRKQAIALEQRALAALGDAHDPDAEALRKDERDQLAEWTK